MYRIVFLSLLSVVFTTISIRFGIEFGQPQAPIIVLSGVSALLMILTSLTANMDPKNYLLRFCNVVNCSCLFALFIFMMLYGQHF